MMHEYKSETYYGVVIGGEQLCGWYCIYAGYPTLQFQHVDGEVVKYSSEDSGNWMKDCWDRFTAMVEERIKKEAA